MRGMVYPLILMMMLENGTEPLAVWVGTCKSKEINSGNMVIRGGGGTTNEAPSALHWGYDTNCNAIILLGANRVECFPSLGSWEFCPQNLAHVTIESVAVTTFEIFPRPWLLSASLQAAGATHNNKTR
jgi:hypothetical protein